MRMEHWQDLASLFVGVWLVLSPLVLGSTGAAVWLTVVLGVGVILFAIEAFMIPSYLEELGEMLLGLALILVPWTIGYESVSAVNSVLAGMLVILFAGWELMMDRDFAAWWHDRGHHRAG